MNLIGAKTITIPEGSVKKITDSLNQVIWAAYDAYTTPFFVECTDDNGGTIDINRNNMVFGFTLKWTKNVNLPVSQWNSISTENPSKTPIPISKGEKVYLLSSATTTRWFETGDQPGINDHWRRMSITGSCKIGGNIMSLVCNDFVGVTTIPMDEALYLALSWNTTITSTEDLVMPATTLTTACYRGLFRGCTSLTNTPILPALILTESCYQEMFYGCSSLNEVTCYATTRVATDCTTDWLMSVATSGTFHKSVGMTWPSGVSGIPSSWTSDEVYIDYTEPFYCENVNTANETINIKKNTNNDNVPTLTIEYSTDRITWSTLGTTSTTALTYTLTPGSKVYFRCNTTNWGIYGSGGACYNPFTGFSKAAGNVMSLIYGSTFNGQMEFRTGETSQFYRLFMPASGNNTVLKDVASLLLPAMSLTQSCYDGMFRNCTKIERAPVLPALHLVASCYNNMFNGDSSLKYIEAMTLDALGSSYSSYWVNKVSYLSTNIFVMNKDATWRVTGTSGIPSKWQIQTK